MLKPTLLEFFVRGIPEAFLFVFAVYGLSKRFINTNRYIISSIIFVMMVYMIRFLPIHYGVHTILNLFVLIILNVNINKINLIESIRWGIVTIILQFVCEGINALIIKYIFKSDINYVFNNPVLKVLYGMPSILIFAIIVITYYARSLKRKELKYISNGESIK